MKNVQMLRTVAGDGQVLKAGKSYELSDDEAARVIADRAAVSLEPARPERAVRAPKEKRA